MSERDEDLPPPSGAQHEIISGRHRAVVTEVGAGLRELSVGATPVIDGYPIDERCSGGRGQVLAPWPNRVGDGRYSFQGREGRAALDEPELGNAIHGLVRWLPWPLISRAGDTVVLGCVLHPQPGYPWRLGLEIAYRLSDDGLAVTTEATNLSDSTAPFGLGFHPYLGVGTATIDPVRLHVPARGRLLSDRRALPTGEMAVAGSAFDFTAGRPIGPMVLDTCYTDLERHDGVARARLEHPDGSRRVTLWVDEGFRYLMVFTGDTVNPPERRRRSVAVEPMTCPPDALRSGRDLIRLDPRTPWRATWGISVEDGP